MRRFPRRRAARCAVGVACLLPAAGACLAAEPPPDPDLAVDGMRRVGPIHLRPFVTLKDAGYDDNVRLEASDRQGDATATIGGGFDAVLLQADRGGVHLSDEADYVSFANNPDLAHWNGHGRGRGILLLNRVALSLEDDFATERERPSSEIDLRLRSRDNRLTAAAALLPRRRLRLRGFARDERIGFSSEEPGAADVAARLGRRETTVGVSGGLAVLPRTTIVAEGQVKRILFSDDAVGGDGRETAARLGLDFDPTGVLQGSVRVGRTSLVLADRPRDDFHGLTGEARLTARLGHHARVRATWQRGTEFSYVAANPYYAATLWTAGYEQALARRLSGEVAYGRGRNAYPEPVLLTGPPERVGLLADRLTTYEAGLSFRTIRGWSIAARAGRLVRDSTDDFHDRSRTVYGVTSTYEF